MPRNPAAALPSTLPPAVQAALRAADVPDETLFLAGEIASFAPGLSGDDRLGWELLAVAAREAHRRGDTRVDLSQPALAALLATLGVPAVARAAATALAARLRQTPALEALVGVAGDYKPFIVDGGHLYQQRVLAVEERLAAALRQRLTAPAFSLSEADLARALGAAAAGPAPLSDEQRAAVRAALLQQLTVITGGPGTGKTSVIAALLRAAAALGLGASDVALAAPTGKAANRINESLAQRRPGGDDPAAAAVPAAQTLHRLLGFRPAAGDFRHHRNHPLPHALVVIDESSMIDLALMERLAGAVGAKARLVLLGDADQLPSVEAGAVFRDLLPLSVHLARSYRMDPETSGGRAILDAASAIRAGRPAALTLAARAQPGDLTFDGVEHFSSSANASPRRTSALDAFLDRWWTRLRDTRPADLARRVYRFPDGSLAPADHADLAAAIAQAHRQRLLCVTRGAARPTGAAAVNAALHRRATAGNRSAAAAVSDFVVGDPVLMTRNDYEHGLYNGDLGVCLRIDDGRQALLGVVFPRGDGFQAFPLASLGPDLELAYALTVHRAQGSEVDAVALILPDDDLPLLSRELLYTALTRARRSVTIVGARSVLTAGIERPIQRSTGLAGRLAVPR